MFYGFTGLVCPETDIIIYLYIFDDKKLPVILLSSAFSVRLSDNQFMNSYRRQFHKKLSWLVFVITSIIFGQNLG
jgi:hypothetical protein